jgi:hypothetical protein
MITDRAIGMVGEGIRYRSGTYITGSCRNTPFVCDPLVKRQKHRYSGILLATVSSKRKRPPFELPLNGEVSVSYPILRFLFLIIMPKMPTESGSLLRHWRELLSLSDRRGGLIAACISYCSINAGTGGSSSCIY